MCMLLRTERAAVAPRKRLGDVGVSPHLILGAPAGHFGGPLFAYIGSNSTPGCEAQGESLNAFINRAITETMERDTAATGEAEV